MSAIAVDVVVVGGGPAGLAAALACCDAGASVHLVSALPMPPPIDTRTTALFPPALDFLASLGLPLAQHPQTAPMTAIRLIDRTGFLLKAPEALFQATEIGLDAFGINVPNAVLTEALANLASTRRSLTVSHSQRMTALATAATGATATLANGEVFIARLVIGADGRHSACRAAAGLAASERPLDQSALVVSFDHQRPHHGVSTEFHRDAGPLTTVPLPGNTSSLVWVERPNIVERLMALGDAELAATISGHVGSVLGTVTGVGVRRAFPLSELHVPTVAANRVALAGEAAHLMPPIGAQGLNLGLRDAAILGGLVAAAIAAGTDIGDDQQLAAYQRQRQTDIRLRQTAVHWLNLSLVADSLPLQLLRGAGLHALRTLGPLRREVMRRGLGLASRQSSTALAPRRQTAPQPAAAD